MRALLSSLCVVAAVVVVVTTTMATTAAAKKPPSALPPMCDTLKGEAPCRQVKECAWTPTKLGCFGAHPVCTGASTKTECKALTRAKSTRACAWQSLGRCAEREQPVQQVGNRRLFVPGVGYTVQARVKKFIPRVGFVYYEMDAESDARPVVKPCKSLRRFDECVSSGCGWSLEASYCTGSPRCTKLRGPAACKAKGLNKWQKDGLPPWNCKWIKKGVCKAVSLAAQAQAAAAGAAGAIDYEQLLTPSPDVHVDTEALRRRAALLQHVMSVEPSTMLSDEGASSSSSSSSSSSGEKKKTTKKMKKAARKAPKAKKTKTPPGESSKIAELEREINALKSGSQEKKTKKTKKEKTEKKVKKNMKEKKVKKAAKKAAKTATTEKKHGKQTSKQQPQLNDVQKRVLALALLAAAAEQKVAQQRQADDVLSQINSDPVLGAAYGYEQSDDDDNEQQQQDFSADNDNDNDVMFEQLADDDDVDADDDVDDESPFEFDHTL